MKRYISKKMKKYTIIQENKSCVKLLYLEHLASVYRLMTRYIHMNKTLPPCDNTFSQPEKKVIPNKALKFAFCYILYIDVLS